MPTKAKPNMNFRSRAPFGVAMKRFEMIGIHPNLDKTGSSKKKSALGPGEYNLQEFECGYKKYNVGGSSWRRKMEVEEFSKNLGFRNPHILKERQFNISIGGPGSYDLPEEIYKKQCPSAIQDVGFGRQRRFWNPVKQNNPPPGTYGKNLAETMGHKQFSNLPTFEWDGFIDRFKSKSPPWAKPPNLYTPNDPGSIRSLLTKVVSKRGPYDCFTGPRDESTIKNHFAPAAFKGPVNWFNVYPNELHILLNHPRKQTYGRFLTEKRFGRATLRHMINDPTQVYKDPDEPSPCSYNVESDKEINQNMYAFNKSVKDARPPTKWKIHPGVGRYNPKYPTCAKPKMQSWVFKSTCGRTEYKAVEYNAF